MTFLGYQVFDWAVAIDSISLSVRSKTNVIGEIYQNRKLNVQQSPYAVIDFVFKQDDNVERGALRDFFIARMGKHEQFFVRSFKNDLKLVHDTDTESNILYVMQGYDKKALEINGKFLYIVGHAQPYIIQTMVEGYDPELDIETVAVELNRSVELYCEAGCTLIEYLYFGRFDTDTLAFEYNDIITSTAKLTFREASDIEINNLEV